MDANIFYGRKKLFLTQTTTKKKAIKALLIAFSDSDEDPDYSPLQTRPSTSLQENDFTDYSSSHDEVLNYGSTFGITLNAKRRKFATN